MSKQTDYKEFVIEEVNPHDDEVLRALGRLRFDVWSEEGEIDAALFPDGVWLDKYDKVSRHWIAYKKNDPTKQQVASARVTVHDTIEASVDGYIWLQNGLPLPEPVSNISKLVVAKEFRRFGLASVLNEIRIKEAKEMGAKCVTSTASDINSGILVSKYGFRDTGKTVIFPNRPKVVFRLVELVF